MLLYINNDVFVSLEYPSRHDRLLQGLDYIVYLLYCIDFYFITVVLKV